MYKNRWSACTSSPQRLSWKKGFPGRSSKVSWSLDWSFVVWQLVFSSCIGMWNNSNLSGLSRTATPFFRIPHVLRIEPIAWNMLKIWIHSIASSFPQVPPRTKNPPQTSRILSNVSNGLGQFKCHCWVQIAATNKGPRRPHPEKK